MFFSRQSVDFAILEYTQDPLFGLAAEISLIDVVVVLVVAFERVS